MLQTEFPKNKSCLRNFCNFRDARTPEEYRLVEGYAEDFLDLVSGHQARLKDQSAPRQRHPGRHSKRGGKVCHKAIFNLQCTRQEAAFSIVSGVIILVSSATPCGAVHGDSSVLIWIACLQQWLRKDFVNFSLSIDFQSADPVDIVAFVGQLLPLLGSCVKYLLQEFLWWHMSTIMWPACRLAGEAKPPASWQQ